MNRLLEKQVAEFSKLRQLAERQSDSHYRRILEGYLRHIALEVGFGPRWEDIFSDELTVADPIYHIHLDGDANVATYDGEEAVRGFYRQMVESKTVSTADFIHVAVADWGIAVYERAYRYLTGAEAHAEGVDVDDTTATYRIGQDITHWWTYDDDARLLGEKVFVLPGTLAVEKVAPEDVFTREDLLTALQPFQGPPTVRR